MRRKYDSVTYDGLNEYQRSALDTYLDHVLEATPVNDPEYENIVNLRFRLLLRPFRMRGDDEPGPSNQQ